MNIIKYKYYITYHYISTISTIEVFPLGVDKLKLEYKGNDGQIFKRRFLSGSLVFINQPLIPSTDYTLFKNIDSSIHDKCSEISLEIKRSCDNGLTYEDNFWNGYFSVTDGTFDLDKCIFTVECQPDDEYRCYIENIENELLLSEVPETSNVSTSIVQQYEFFTCRDTLGNCNALRPDPQPADTWLIFHQEICESSQNYIYYREVTIVACENGVAVSPGGGGDPWYQDTSYGDCVNGLSKWVRKPQIVVTNNPNPEVFAGNCIDGTDTPPPKRVFLGVVKQSTPPNPVIVGKNIIFDDGVGAGTAEYFYVKFPKANATYLWGITGAGNTITSGGTTSDVVVNINSAGSVTVIETTSCGASATISQVFTLSALGGASTYNSEVVIIGNDELCVGETAQYCLNAETGRTPAIIGGTSMGSVLNVITVGQGTHGCFEVIAGTAGTIIVNYGGGASRDSSTISSITITVKVKKSIEAIYGDGTVCNNSQAYYSIPDTDLGGFAWEVDGGTITSGQGTNEILVTWDGSNGIGFVYVLQDFNCGCNWIRIAPCFPGQCSWWWCPEGNDYTFTNNHLFEDVVYAVRGASCDRQLNLPVKSDFFEWNPPGDTPGYVAGINYVTGEENQLPYISFISLREIVFSFTSNTDFQNPTLDERVSWKQIEEILREVFNAYWFLENGNLRIEHISWFNRVVTYDLTDSFYRKYSVGKNIYSYNKIKAPKFERFKWKSAVYTDFIGAEISYAGTCTTNEESQKVKNRGVSYLQTDLLNIFNLQESAGRDGFVLLLTDSAFTVKSEEGLISTLIQPNAHVSWANLHYNYHRHDRVLLNGMMNLEQTIFLSALRYKTQEGVRFPYCCEDELNPLTDLIRTSVGDGVLEEAEHDLLNDTLTVKLLHDF